MERVETAGSSSPDSKVSCAGFLRVVVHNVSFYVGKTGYIPGTHG